MHAEKMEIIKQLMEQLEDAMEYGAEDFDEKLGKKSPMLEKAEEEIGMDLDGDKEMGEGEDHIAMIVGKTEDEKPEDYELKDRIMKMRG